jgi:uncharacterized RDD family membrane protein YckC
MENEFQVSDDLLASNQQRLANYIIDYVIRTLLGGLIGAAIGLTAYFGENIVLETVRNMNKIEEYIFGCIVSIIYYNLVEIFLSRSFAKFITKTIVVMEDGSKPDYKTILLRTICRLIPLNHLSFLGTPCRGWHDSISKTYVVKKDLFEQKKDLFYSFEQIGEKEEDIN